MSNDFSNTGDTLNRARQIDEICDGFEAAWIAGQGPSMENCLARAAGVDRVHLLRELLPIDLFYRVKNCEEPSSADYIMRFPELDQAWIERVTRSVCTADTLVVARRQAGHSELSVEQIDGLVQCVSDRSHCATHSSLLDSTNAPGATRTANVQELISLMEPACEPDELGRLGNFRVLKLLGHGGMGAVFLAQDLQLHRQVALKMLKADHVCDRDAVERFMREARAAAAVRHDNVVTIFQVGQARGVPFLAQELLEGETLEDRLRRDEKLPIGDALQIGREVAAGLAAAHQRGLLHRDIKPSNVWLEGRELGVGSRAKLLDFGLARVETDDVQLTKTGMIIGTPAFMSPEQAQGKPLDIRSDLFSLGCVLYRMVTGRLPFQGSDTLSMLRSLAVDEPPPARKRNPEASIELSDFIAKLLHKDPLQRPTSAEDVVTQLAAMAEQWHKHAAGQASSAELSAIGRLATRIKLRKTSSIRIALAAAAAIVCGAIIITITRPDGTKTKLEVDGEAKVDIAIDHSKPKAVTEGTAEKPKSVTDSRGSVPIEQPPIYETEFSAVDPKWLTVQPNRTSEIRDGHLVLHQSSETTGRPLWLRGAPSVPKMDQADIEVVGRATTGMWGLWVMSGGAGFVVDFDNLGQVQVRRYEQVNPGFFILRPNTAIPLPAELTGVGEFNRLRVAWRDRSVDVWLNGEPACETVKFDQSLDSAMIGLFARPIPYGDSFECEFDSFRIWRAGEGPPPTALPAMQSIPKSTSEASDGPSRNRDSHRVPQPTTPEPNAPIAIAKPIYEIDFSTPDPNWLTPNSGGAPDIRDGYFVMQSNVSPRRLRTARSVPMLDEADFEVLGRAKSGIWGICVINMNDRGRGIILAFDKQGQVSARHCWVPPGATDWSFFPIPVSQLPIKPRRDGEFNVLRVAWRDSSLEVWLNGEPACEAIKLDQSPRSAQIGFSAVPDPDSGAFDCEFDSLRIWRAGDGPPPQVAAVPAKQPSIPPEVTQSPQKLPIFQPLFENDFSSDKWLQAKGLSPSARDIFSISDGRLTIQVPANDQNSSPFYYLSIGPKTDSADIEIVGRSKLGSWGFCLVSDQEPRYAMAVGLDPQGGVRACRKALLPTGGYTTLAEIPIQAKSISWQYALSCNVLRAIVKDQQVRLWINGNEACDPIPIPDSMPQMFVTLAAQNSKSGLFCEFDSARVWRAGDGPPLLPLPTEQPSSKPSAAPSERETTEKTKPLYEKNFSTIDQEWVSPSFRFRDGRLNLQSPNRASFVSQTVGEVPLLESADIEVTGRATSGYFGCTVLSQIYGMAFGLDSQGKLGVWQIDVVQSRPPGQRIGEHYPINDLRVRTIHAWKGNGAANTLRVSIDAHAAQVWINGELACDAIRLKEPLGLFRGGLGGVDGEEPVNCQFDSLRIWRAGEAPPPNEDP